MSFEYDARQRFDDILREEWSKGTGAVHTGVVVGRMRDEGFNFEGHEVGSLLILYRDQGQATILAESEAELASEGRAVVTHLSD